jgi:hypothetical protein
MLVKAELERLGLHCTTVELGEVSITGGISDERRDDLNHALENAGLGLMDDKKPCW